MKTHITIPHALRSLQKPLQIAGLSLFALTSSVSGQATPETPTPDSDPFEGKPEEKKAAPEPQSVKVIYEVFSLPMAAAAEIIREAPKDQEIYDGLIEKLNEDIVKQEKHMAARVVPGQVCSVEELEEFIYQTEVEPAELPNVVSTSAVGLENFSGTALFPRTPASPSAFDTKNTGDTLQLEVASNGDPDSLKFSIRLTSVTIKNLGRSVHGSGVSTVEMPNFSVQKIQTSLVATNNQARFLGTFNPSDEKLPGDTIEVESGRTWFAFLTVKADR